MTVRDQLIVAGVELLEKDGLANLSQRQIARRAGVSHGAPRHHFAGYSGLLAAIAHEGVNDLDRKIEGCLAGAEPLDALMRTCLAVLDFAVARPAMFELISRHDLLGGAGGGLRQTTGLWLAAVTNRLCEAQPAAGTADALALWAGVQGLGTMLGRRSMEAIMVDSIKPELVLVALIGGLTGREMPPPDDGVATPCRGPVGRS